MSFQMQTALKFARWVITKNQGTVFDASIVDDSAWIEFMSTDEAIEASKTAVAQIIPQVVEKMPAPKKKAAPRPRKTKSDAQSQTLADGATETVEEPAAAPTEVPVAEEPAVKKPKKKTKKPKAEEPAAKTDAIVAEEPAADPTEIPVVEEPAVEKPVADKKPKKTTKKPKAEEPAADPTEIPVAEKPVADKKPKKTTKKPKAEEPAVEVVIPDAEAERLAHSPNYANDVADFDAKSLSEEPYEQETEFEEVFVNEVLYYVDSNDNWLDAQQNPVSKPIA